MAVILYGFRHFHCQRDTVVKKENAFEKCFKIDYQGLWACICISVHCSGKSKTRHLRLYNFCIKGVRYRNCVRRKCRVTNRTMLGQGRETTKITCSPTTHWKAYISKLTCCYDGLLKPGQGFTYTTLQCQYYGLGLCHSVKNDCVIHPHFLVWALPVHLKQKGICAH